MYYSAIGLLAFLILLIENYDVFLNLDGAFARPAWKAYRRFLLAVLVYYITDILWGLLESRKLAGALFADTTVYFIAMAAGVLCWTQYTVTYLGEKNAFGRVLLYTGRIVATLVTLLTIVNIFAPVLFTVDDDCVYHALSIRYVILAFQILLLLLISVYAVTSMARQKNAAEKAKQYRTLAFFGLIMAVFLFAQLWYPYLPLYAIAYLLGTCLLHTFVINDEKESYKRGMEEAVKITELKDTIASLLDNMPAMTFTKHAETGVYLACNQAFADYAHKESPAGVAGLTDEEIFDPETAAHFVEDDRMAMSMDEPYIFFEDVPDAAGNRRQLQTTKQKYIDTAGRLCILGICQDVTDMTRIQRENAMTREAYEKARSTGIIYTHIAQSLARGYAKLYYVNLNSEEFIEYRTQEESGMLTETRRGWHFFEECQIGAEQVVYPDDLEEVKKSLDRKTLVSALDRNKTFSLTYRLNTENEPVYYRMRVSRMEDDERFIIIGVMNVNEEMQQRSAVEQAKEEQIAYGRVNALNGDILSIYVVGPTTWRYRQFSASEAFADLGFPKEGMGFFPAIREWACSAIYPDDLDRFLSSFTQESVMEELAQGGVYSLSCRLHNSGKPKFVQFKIAKIVEKEKNGPRLIFGIIDIDTRVRQEEDYAKRLAQARIEAKIDALTGVKNRHAYLEAEERLNLLIADQRAPEFAIVLMDVNDLKKVNDTEGHEAGDRYLRDACKIICETFKRSPVFRVGGDEFTVIVQGNDYDCIENLIAQMDEHNEEAINTGGIVIACGMAKYQREDSVAPVFARADHTMYENKSELKERKNRLSD